MAKRERSASDVIASEESDERRKEQPTGTKVVDQGSDEDMNFDIDKEDPDPMDLKSPRDNLLLPPEDREDPVGELNEFRMRSFVNAEMYNDDEEKISYLKLVSHIQQNHPMNKSGKRFGICEELGFLPCFECCFQMRKKKNSEDEEIDVSLAQQQLGLGPTLLLMLTKAFAFLFLFLTLINVPVYAFFYSGNITE